MSFTQPPQITGQAYTLDSAGNVVGGIGVNFELITPPALDGYSVDVSSAFTSYPLTDADATKRGRLDARLLCGATYRMKRDDGDTWVTFTTPGSGSTFVLPLTLAATYG